MAHNDSLVSLSTFGEKWTLDFESLIDCPNILQNSSNTSHMAEQFTQSALANKIILSANSKWEKVGPLWDAVTGCQSFALKGRENPCIE